MGGSGRSAWGPRLSVAGEQLNLPVSQAEEHHRPGPVGHGPGLALILPSVSCSAQVLPSACRQNPNVNTFQSWWEGPAVGVVSWSEGWAGGAHLSAGAHTCCLERVRKGLVCVWWG